MAGVEIAIAGPLDASAIALLHGRLFSPPWTTLEVAQLMVHPGAAAFVAQGAAGEGVAGYILGRVAADEAELLSIGVTMAHRRQGIARNLMQALAARVREMGATRLYLEVSAANPGAVALYQVQGFTRIGVRRGYYRLPGQPAEDALLLALELAPQPLVD